MEKFPEYLLVSFIGKQTYLDLKAAELPFDVQEITKVTEYYSGSLVTLTTTVDGWKRLTRPSGKSYFKLYYQSKPTGMINRKSGSDIKLFPNPANNQLNVEQSPQSGYLSIYSMQGQELIKQTLSGIITQIDVALLASGVYILNIVHNGSCEVRKFVKR